MLLKAVILLECMLSIGSIASNTATGPGSGPLPPPSRPPPPPSRPPPPPSRPPLPATRPPLPATRPFATPLPPTTPPSPITPSPRPPTSPRTAYPSFTTSPDPHSAGTTFPTGRTEAILTVAILPTSSILPPPTSRAASPQPTPTDPIAFPTKIFSRPMPKRH